jgi:hypothetical protein
MRKTTSAAIVVTLMIFTLDILHAGTVTTTNVTPAVDDGDIENLIAYTGGVSMWGDRPIIGQTFTNGPSAGTLSAITIQIGDSDGNISGWKDYWIRIGTVTNSGSSYFFNELYQETIRQNNNVTSDYYFTFTLSEPFVLSNNTLHAFEIGLPSSQDGWSAGIPSARISGDTSPLGTRFQGENVNNITTDQVNLQPNPQGDMIFHLAIEPPPPSGTFIMIK